MLFEVELPDLGSEGGDHARVAEWHFDEGDFVVKGEALLEVAGEGAALEVPCTRAGVLIERLVAEDEVVRVGDPLALMDSRASEATDDEDTDEDDENLPAHGHEDEE